MTTSTAPSSFPSQEFLDSVPNKYNGRTLLLNELKKLSEKPDDVRTIRVLHNMAIDTQHGGNNQASAELLSFIIPMRERVLGLDHTDTIGSMHYLGLAQTNLSQMKESESTWRTIISRLEHKDQRASLGAKSNLGSNLNGQKRFVEAESVLRDLRPQLLEVFKEDDPRCLGNLRGLMMAVGGQGRHDEARELCEQGLDIVGKMEGQYKDEETVAMKEMEVELKKWRNGGD